MRRGSPSVRSGSVGHHSGSFDRRRASYIDVIAPSFMAMIKYCEAEEVNQSDYLNALTEAKFKKKLHLVRRRRNPDEYDD